MKKGKEFSVIVPVYNREHLIQRCLDSIKAQTYRPIHLIIIDNNSTDNTLKTVKKWVNENEALDFRISVLQEEKPGACAARNSGLRRCESECLCFFDSDDAMRPELVAKAMSGFTENQNAGIVYWKVMSHPLSGTPYVMKFTEDSSRIFHFHLVHALLRTQGFAMRASLIRESGCWNEGLPVWNDWELGIRLLLQNPECVVIPEVLADSYAQRESITGTDISSRAGLWEQSLDAAERAVKASDGQDCLLTWIDYRRSVLAALYAREGTWVNAEGLMKKIHHRQFVMNMVYAWTRMGLRGASRWARFLLP